MLNLRTATTLVVVAVALLAGASSSSIAQSDASRVASRLGNDVHSEAESARDSDIDWGNAVGVVHAPFERVVEAVSDYRNYRRFLPFFTQSRVVSERGSRALVYMEASVLHGSVTLWANMRMSSRPPQGDTRVVEGRMADGNMGDFRARWELTPLNDGQHTLVRLKVLIDPDLPLPDSICSSENVNTARRTIVSLRRFLGVSVPSS